MGRPNPGKLAAFAVLFTLLAGLPVWLKGGLYLTNYEGDALHLADIVLRMADGARPHVDFSTPLGALGFWPFVPFVMAGWGLGHAFAAGQTGFALVALIPVVWAAATRLSPRIAFGFVAACVVLLTSLSHGASGSMIAISMHYNRWAWVLCFAAILLVLLEPRDRRPWLEGGFLAALFAGLSFLKGTYIVAFAPVLLLILVVRRDWALLRAALVAGAGLGAILFVVLGPGFIAAYAGDLLDVAGAEVRRQPGQSLRAVAISPGALVATLIPLIGMVLLRRSGAETEGLGLLLLTPAFVYVTWQNFGNDPVWLILVAVLLAAMRPERDAEIPPERDPSVGLALAGVAALVLSVPILQNHATSGVRLFSANPASYQELVPGRGGLEDVHIVALPANLVRARRNLTDPGAPYEALADRVPAFAPISFQGETLPNCQIVTGIPASLAAMAGDLEGEVFIADLISSHWLYAGAPLSGGAPWNYGSLAGLENTDHLVVPLCPIDLRARKAILSQLEDHAMTLIGETEFYRLYRIN